MDTEGTPAKNGRIIHIWDVRDWAGVGHFKLVGIRKTGGKYEVSKGSPSYKGLNGTQSGYRWYKRLALLDTEAEARAYVEQHFPSRDDRLEMECLEEIRAARRG